MMEGPPVTPQKGGGHKGPISQLEMKESTRNKLMIPQRLNQQHQLEEYSIDACSDDQKMYCHIFYSISKGGTNLPRILKQWKLLLP